MQKNLVIVIGGPTASGKSGLAIDVAKEFNGVVVNADSMQVYKDTPTLSACPSVEDKKTVPHKLYEIYESSHHGTVAEWLKAASRTIREIWSEEKTPIVVGGSGMYIDILINGMSPIPETPKNIQDKISKMLEEKGVNELYEILKKQDLISAEKLNPNDTTRIRRAYEVLLHTGKSISKWHEEENIKSLPEATFFTIKITPETQELDEAGFGRFDKMIELGALEEVRNLKLLNLNKNLPAMKALGVPELIDYLDGKTSLKEAIDLAKLHTRQYAKRQRTWFNNKLEANMTLNKCYCGDKNVIKELKNVLHKSL